MALERTLSIIKPDAVSRNISGLINAEIEKAGLIIKAQKMLQLNKKQAEEFYYVHKERAFFNSLVTYMISNRIIVQVLEGENAILKYREVMGATDPDKASSETIRKKFGINIEHNSVHGSDSQYNADYEINFFFARIEIM